MNFPLYALTTHDGPVVIGRYESESEQRRAYTAARKRLIEGGYSPDVRDIALGEDPGLRHIRGAGSAERPGTWAAAIEQLALL